MNNNNSNNNKELDQLYSKYISVDKEVSNRDMKCQCRKCKSGEIKCSGKQIRKKGIEYMVSGDMQRMFCKECRMYFSIPLEAAS